MAYTIISQNNTTTTLQDENGNIIYVPGRVTLATSTDYTITEVNNNTATLTDGSGKVIRDVPCVVVLAGGGSSDTHNKGYYATPEALAEAEPIGEAGDWAIVGSTDTVWVWDEDSSAWVDTDTKGEVTPDMIIVKSATMPTASTTPAGAVYQYVGASDANYTHGYIYENVATTTSSSATASQTTGSSLSDVAVVLATFETQITTSGSYAFTSDGTNWSYDGNTVDLTDYGITYTGTPVADDVITVVYTESSTTYAWTRIDVQPSPNPLPSQTGQSGKFLTTDGTDASWSDKPLVNKATGTNSIAIGSGSASGANTISVGATSSGNGSIFIGSLTQGTNAQDEIAVGWYAAGGAQNGITIGGYNSSGTVPFGTICIGRYANPTPIRNENEKGTFWVTLWKSASSSGTYKLMSSDGTIPADRLVHAINKYSTMPTAASTNEGWIVQFTGTTDATYTHGHLYECVSDGQTPATYSWTEVQLGGGGLQNTATGTNSLSVLGSTVTNSNCVVVGKDANSSANFGTAIGRSAVTAGTYAVAIGSSAQAGYNKDYAIQIGRGTNSNANTLSIGLGASNNYELLSADGTIPAARHAALPAADGTYTLQLVIADGVPTLSWVAV